MFVVGDKEIENNEVSVRTRDSKDTSTQKLEEALENISKIISEKSQKL